MNGTLKVEPNANVEMADVFAGVLENAGRVLVSGVFQGEVLRNDGELLARAGSIWRTNGRNLVLGADGSLTEGGGSYTVTADSPMCRFVGGRFEPARFS